MKDRFLREYQAFESNQGISHLILAISGGVDSVVLAKLCHDNGLPFTIAHCNFQLRGNQSDEDQRFVEKLGKEMGVEVLTKPFDTENWAKEHGVSIQMAARTLRYAWFEELTSESGTYIATAHHANDVAETMLFNLAKGTGLAGLHGIPTINGKTIRPILWAEKEEILLYAKAQGLGWREDSSNKETKYTRNSIRQKIIPVLEDINPAFINSINKTSSRIADAEMAIQEFVKSLSITKKTDDGILISKKILASIEGRLTVLYNVISPYGFSYDQTEQILASIDRVGACFYCDNYVLNIDRESILVSAMTENPGPVQISEQDKQIKFGDAGFTISTHKANEYSIKKNPKVGAFDLDKLKFPLAIRVYQEGDKFQPLGMSGKKLISDYLIDEKVPMNLKKRQAVLVSGADIIWVVGRRISDRYKIDSGTQLVYELRIEND